MAGAGPNYSERAGPAGHRADRFAKGGILRSTKIAKSGLSDRVNIGAAGMHNKQGSYDEHRLVDAAKRWANAIGLYFNSLRDRLKPGRNATLQIITIADNRWHMSARVSISSRNPVPGRHVQRLGAAGRGGTGGHAGERLDRIWRNRLTLRRWHEGFTARWDEVKRMGFDKRSKRMWDFYLASCAGAFKVEIAT